MLKTVSTGLLAYVLVFALNSGSASATTLDIPISSAENSAAVRLTTVVEETQLKEEIETNEAEKAEVTHVISENESLSDIAKQNNTTWKRLFDKNTIIESPDLVNPGDVIVIPGADESLVARELPTPLPAPEPVVRTISTNSSNQPKQVAAQPVAARGSSSGNGYSYGYCTWYVKNVRPDLPNNLGNANTWVSRAAAQGYATGSAPRVGAVAMARTGYMHVAYVTGVNADGTVNLSEMNFNGWGVVSTRTAPASAFSYIY